MNKDVIEVNGKKYYSTNLAKKLAPEVIGARSLLYFMQMQDQYFMLQSYIKTTNGLRKLVPNEWRVDLSENDDHIDFPNNTYVDVAELRFLHEFLHHPAVSPLRYLDDYHPLPEGVLLFNDASLSSQNKSDFQRVNSRAKKEGRLKQAMEVVIERARQQGMELNTSSLPGVKRQMLAILVRLDPQLEMKMATFDEYANDLGWRWKQGAKEHDGYELLNIFIPNI